MGNYFHRSKLGDFLYFQIYFPMKYSKIVQTIIKGKLSIFVLHNADNIKKPNQLSKK